MKHIVWGTLLLALLASAALVLLLFAPTPVQAQTADACYGVADNGGPFGNEDTLVTVDRVTGVTTLIGYTGTTAVEAIAFAPGGGNLYAADNGQLGILSLGTGAFTALPSPFGAGSNGSETINFNDVDGLSYDATTGILYGTHRVDGVASDVLIQIDRTTGAHVPDAFGPGIDYVTIEGPGLLGDIDDIAVDPLTGVMYATSNLDGDGGVLVTLNKETGGATLVGELGVDDIEGLAYFNDGVLYGSTGKDGSDATTRNRLYRIDETTAAATYVATFDDFQDYEALDCLTGPTSITLAGVSVTDAPTISVFLVTVLLGLIVLTLLALRRRTF